ncbi:hypothetical protein Fcan01_11594 [Folsomia candida]|uniref:Uncharacterized protein n=1 Tax=Folsomia candida TaxID=158441 RepID=A0A226E7M5_FOLCA|nr:hypothetical protein Fcan01_11594 [Folsomia candida]
MTENEFRFVNFYTGRFRFNQPIMSELNTYTMNEMALEAFHATNVNKKNLPWQIESFRFSFTAMCLHRFCFYDYKRRRKVSRMPFCDRPRNFPRGIVNETYETLRKLPLIDMVLNLVAFSNADESGNHSQSVGIRILASCKKSALVPWTNDMQETMARTVGKYSHVTRRPYKILKGTVFPRRKHFLVSRAGWDLLRGGIGRILESGIYWKWLKFYDALNIAHYKSVSNSEDEIFQPQVLVSNIGTIFLVLSGGCGVGLVLFLCEIVGVLGIRKRLTSLLAIGSSEVIDYVE